MTFKERRAAVAAAALISAFVWDETDEGHAYWSLTYRRLVDRAGGEENVAAVERAVNDLQELPGG